MLQGSTRDASPDPCLRTATPAALQHFADRHGNPRPRARILVGALVYLSKVGSRATTMTLSPVPALRASNLQAAPCAPGAEEFRRAWPGARHRSSAWAAAPSPHVSFRVAPPLAGGVVALRSTMNAHEASGGTGTAGQGVAADIHYQTGAGGEPTPVKRQGSIRLPVFFHPSAMKLKHTREVRRVPAKQVAITKSLSALPGGPTVQLPDRQAASTACINAATRQPRWARLPERRRAGLLWLGKWHALRLGFLIDGRRLRTWESFRWRQSTPCRLVGEDRNLQDCQASGSFSTDVRCCVRGDWVPDRGGAFSPFSQIRNKVLVNESEPLPGGGIAKSWQASVQELELWRRVQINQAAGGKTTIIKALRWPWIQRTPGPMRCWAAGGAEETGRDQADRRPGAQVC